MTKTERSNLRAIRSRARAYAPDLVERLIVLAQGRDWAAIEAAGILLRLAYPRPRVRTAYRRGPRR